MIIRCDICGTSEPDTFYGWGGGRTTCQKCQDESEDAFDGLFRKICKATGLEKYPCCNKVWDFIWFTLELKRKGDGLLATVDSVTERVLSRAGSEGR